MTQPLSSPAVIIVGASLAGAAAAIELGRRGVSVLLLDKANFPRRKPCGEGLSSRGRAELGRLGVSEQELQAIGRELGGYQISYKGGLVEIPDSSGLLGVPREKLDDLLLRRALGYQGVRLQSGAAVSSVTRRGERFEVAWNDGAASSEVLLVADGVSSKAGRALGLVAPVVEKPRHGTSSAWRVRQGSLPPYVTVLLVQGGEIYVTPLANDRCNVSVLGTKELVQKASRLEFLREILQHAPALAGLEWELLGEPLGAGPINIGYRASEVGGAFVVGDACETLDPCGGFGMTHALLSGRIAAECVSRALGSDDREGEVRRYAREREEAVRDMRGFTRMTALMLGSGLGRTVLPLAARARVVQMFSHAVHRPRHLPIVDRLNSIAGVRRNIRSDEAKRAEQSLAAVGKSRS